MARANIHDRGSIELVYPRDAFARDAAANEPPAQVLRGVRIASAPDAAGDFNLEPAGQQVGEAPGAVFLAPRRREEALVDRGRVSGPQQVAYPDPDAGYRTFLDDIVAAAKARGFERRRAPGRGDTRLRGPRQ